MESSLRLDNRFLPHHLNNFAISVEGIAAANNTSLAVVAPGIAEALFATAMGLAAAIPAVVAYNKITVDLGRFAGRMQGLIGRSGGLLAQTAAGA